MKYIIKPVFGHYAVVQIVDGVEHTITIKDNRIDAMRAMFKLIIADVGEHFDK